MSVSFHTSLQKCNSHLVLHNFNRKPRNLESAEVNGGKGTLRERDLSWPENLYLATPGVATTCEMSGGTAVQTHKCRCSFGSDVIPCESCIPLCPPTNFVSRINAVRLPLAARRWIDGGTLPPKP